MASPQEHAIQLDQLTRAFRVPGGHVKRSVDRLDLCVARGELFGLLGPNGAGKTTTAKMLMTTLLPTSGTARVLGHDVVKDTALVRRRIGVILGGDLGLYPRLSGRDNLLLFADLYGIPYREQKRRVPELLDMVGLAGSERKRVETYSRGMRQRLHIARGLIHDPDVVILDEPSNGIDPVGARELRTLVRERVRDGRTVMLTTHYMFEAEELCDRVAVLRSGRKIAEGRPTDIKRRTDCHVVLSVEVRGAGDDHLGRLRGLPGVRSVSLSEQDGTQTVDVHSSQDAELTPAVLDALDGVSVLRVSKREPTLEDAYVSLVSGQDQ
ncbi:ATP-binding cassette domain-containing protein [Streptomyces sp. R44]|uniref:ATP-binding cassette domain-containing protein n=1 Tax=Streptomyces sp. R44 TaxID=3238633 RepID=A0AB39TA63_9ACTN